MPPMIAAATPTASKTPSAADNAGRGFSDTRGFGAGNVMTSSRSRSGAGGAASRSSVR